MPSPLPGETLIWTALPNGMATVDADGHQDTQLRLSVFITPRLQPSPTGPDGTAPLTQFPDWIDWPLRVRGVADHRDPVSIQVEVTPENRDPITLDARIVPPDDPWPQPDIDLWRAVFPATTRVRPFTPPAPIPTIRSFPVRSVLTSMRAPHLALLSDAVSITANGATVEPRAGFPPLNLEDEIRLVLLGHDPTPSYAYSPITAKYLGQALAAIPARTVTFDTVADPPKNLAHLSNFHAKFLNGTPIRPVLPTPDFHSAIASFVNWPLIMRRLGLVLDLVVVLPSPSVVPDGPVEVRIVPVWSSNFVTTADLIRGAHSPEGVITEQTPYTKAEIHRTVAQFRARSKAASTSPSARPDDEIIADGMLMFENPAGLQGYDMVGVDVDGAGIKTIQYATALDTAGNKPAPDSPKVLAAPTVRSAGISVAHFNRATALHARLTSVQATEGAIQAGTPVRLWADDLVRGYRIDIGTPPNAIGEDPPKKWSSLCERVGNYTVPGLPPNHLPANLADEGFVSLAATKKTLGPDDTSNTDLYLHESLFRWTGWSLVAPRPGRTVASPGDPKADDHGLTTGDSDPTTISAKFVPAPGSLPLLRFGRKYTVRARTVDLAGNGRTVDDLAAPQHYIPVRDAIVYRRHEPVSAPTILMHAPKTPGESVDRIVIRSNYAGSIDAAPTTAVRHIVPPKIGELMAEELGLLDGADGRPDQSKYDLIRGREAAIYGEPSPGVGPLVSGPDKVNVQPVVDPNYDQPYFPVDLLPVPYLPDGLSVGVSLVGLPGYTGTGPLQVPFDFAPERGWPDARTFRIQVLPGAAAPQVIDPSASASRLLRVSAPQALVATVTLSSYLDDRIDMLGEYDFILNAFKITAANQDLNIDDNEAPPGANEALKKRLMQLNEAKAKHSHELQAQFTALALAGQIPQVTPPRTLTVVHAVRQPLTEPFILGPASRSVGQNSADLPIDGIDFDLTSSLSLDVLASWSEILDDGPAPSQRMITDSHAFRLRSDPNPAKQGSFLVEGESTHQFGDTKYRAVGYRAIATSRFAEYFKQFGAHITLTGTAPTLVDRRGIAPGSEEVKSLDGKTKYLAGRDYVVENASGQIYRTVHSFIPEVNGVAHVVVDSLPTITRDGPTTEMNVPSSARPPAPSVLYVIPTYGWTKSSKGNAVSHTRHGKGLRVYLNRPWYQSGGTSVSPGSPGFGFLDDTVGERLGVVLGPPVPPPINKAAPLVTRYGRDPMFGSNSVKRTPLVGDFRGRTETGTSLTLEDGTVVDVAGHQVRWDPDRSLWYCDIEIDAGYSYTPWVRLALARYQPFAIPGQELSHVVVADFAQLAPDRNVTLVRSSATKATVTVSGISYGSVSAPPSLFDVPLRVVGVPVKLNTRGPSQMVAVLELHDPAIPGELGWSEHGRQVSLKASVSSDGTASWTADVTLLDGKPATSGMRVAIREYEALSTEGNNQPQGRLVFADSITLVEPPSTVT